jgi:asparagine synthase (glutamine-hydrolysing)
LESCWYMRNQLLRDTDWSSMAHGLEVRLPFVDATLLEHLGPAIASESPPRKRDLAGCGCRLQEAFVERRKIGFTTPLRTWIGAAGGNSTPGSRVWAANVHRLFVNTTPPGAVPEASRIAA